MTQTDDTELSKKQLDLFFLCVGNVWLSMPSFLPVHVKQLHVWFDILILPWDYNSYLYFIKNNFWTFMPLIHKFTK